MPNRDENDKNAIKERLAQAQQKAQQQAQQKAQQQALQLAQQQAGQQAQQDAQHQAQQQAMNQEQQEVAQIQPDQVDEHQQEQQIQQTLQHGQQQQDGGEPHVAQHDVPQVEPPQPTDPMLLMVMQQLQKIQLDHQKQQMENQQQKQLHQQQLQQLQQLNQQQQAQLKQQLQQQQQQNQQLQNQLAIYQRQSDGLQPTGSVDYVDMRRISDNIQPSIPIQPTLPDMSPTPDHSCAANTQAYQPSVVSLASVNTLTPGTIAPPALPAVGGTEKVYVPEPGFFCGRTGEDANKWFKAIDRYHSSKRITNDHAAATSFASRLDKNALMWYDKLPQHIQMSYTALRNSFYGAYIANMDQDVGFSELAKMRLKTDEDWDDLVLRHGQICDRMQIYQPSVRLSIFKGILPQSIIGMVKGMKYDSVEECAKFAKNIYEYESRKLKINAIQEPNQRVQTHQSAGSWRGRGSFRGGRSFGRGFQGRFPQQSQQQYRPETRECYNCRNTDHIARNCPNNLFRQDERVKAQSNGAVNQLQSLNQ